MRTLLFDLRSLQLAPTVRRELAARTVGAVPLVLVVLLVADSVTVKASLVTVYTLYAATRVLLVARSRRRVTASGSPVSAP